MVEVGTLVMLPEVALQYDWSKQVTKPRVYPLAGQPCLHSGWGWHSGLATTVLGHHTSLSRGDVYVCMCVCIYVCVYSCVYVRVTNNSNGEDCALTT